MHIFLTTLLLSVAQGLFLAHESIAQQANVDYQWEEKRDRDGIRIFTSKVSGSPFKAVRGEMVVKASVAQLVALVNDLSHCHEWADLCKTSKALEVISSSEQIVHIHNNIPFPVKDRDVVAHMMWVTDRTTGRISMISKALSKIESQSRLPSTHKAVRVYDAETHWHFTPVGGGVVRVENFAHIDPNGPTPAWLTNLLLVSSPFKTMQSMRELVEAGKYNDVILPF